MKTYTLTTNKTKERLNSNCYVRLSYVKDKEKLIDTFNMPLLISNLEDPNKFVNDLVSYEDISNNGKRKDTKSNYGIILTFLLEEMENKEDLTNVVKEIVKHYNNLPYFSYLTTKGKGNYLNIFFSERYYYPNGYVKEVKAQKDSYRNSKTGKTCKENDKNAILWHKKGDILSTTTTIFSSKVRYFRYASEQHFYKCMDDLKLFFIELCKKVFKTIVYTGITFKKYVLSILTSKQKQVARVWHKALYKMEDRFNLAIDSLDHTDYLEDAKEQLDQLYIKYNALIHNNKHYYDDKEKYYIPVRNGKIKFSIDFNNNYYKAKEDANLLIDKFNKELDAIVYEFLPQNY